MNNETLSKAIVELMSATIHTLEAHSKVTDLIARKCPGLSKSESELLLTASRGDQELLKSLRTLSRQLQGSVS